MLASIYPSRQKRMRPESVPCGDGPTPLAGGGDSGRSLASCIYRAAGSGAAPRPEPSFVRTITAPSRASGP